MPDFTEGITAAKDQEIEYLKEQNEALEQENQDLQAELNQKNAKLARIRQEAS